MDTFTALVLVCSLATTPDLSQCDRSNAVAYLRVPGEFTNTIACGMQGQALLASMPLGEDLGKDERVRVVCYHNKRTER
jgi:hypothetical protein